MKKSLLRFISFVLIPLFLSSCVTTYRDFPNQMVGKTPDSNKEGTLYYKIKKFPVIDSGGERTLYKIFQDKTPFRNTKETEAIPDEGVYCLVETQYKPFSVPALIFGYISVSFLTLLPAWSTQDGWRVRYHLYVNGKEKDVYSYEITRKAGLWLGLLPFFWVNFLTYSEADAFEATTYQFFKDANL